MGYEIRSPAAYNTRAAEGYAIVAVVMCPGFSFPDCEEEKEEEEGEEDKEGWVWEQRIKGGQEPERSRSDKRR